MKISIITAVYKAESFLRRCVDSIIAQTYLDWELILVDDGSPDKSGNICDEYAAKDSRIKVIHKVNGGVSSARQMGLEFCTGDYIVHADSDDWLSPIMLELLSSHAKETDADVILFDFYRVTNGKELLIKQQPAALENIQVLKDIIGGRLYASCWSKLVKRSTVLKYGASFPQGINLGEDKCFLASLMKNSVSVSYLGEALYYYDATIKEESLVRRITKESMESGFAMVSYLEGLLDSDFERPISEIKINLKIRAIKSGLFSGMQIWNLYREAYPLVLMDIVKNKSLTKKNIQIILSMVGLYWIAKFI